MAGGYSLPLLFDLLSDFLTVYNSYYPQLERPPELEHHARTLYPTGKTYVHIFIYDLLSDNQIYSIQEKAGANPHTGAGNALPI